MTPEDNTAMLHNTLQHQFKYTASVCFINPFNATNKIVS
jgi:hypothetical protein